MLALLNTYKGRLNDGPQKRKKMDILDKFLCGNDGTMTGHRDDDKVGDNDCSSEEFS